MLKSGANWGTWENLKCTSCMNTTQIVYIFLISGIIRTQECVDCMGEHN